MLGNKQFLTGFAIPIAPEHPLIRIFKVIHDTIIECFSVCGGISSGKHGGRAECKSDLDVKVGINVREVANNLTNEKLT